MQRYVSVADYAKLQGVSAQAIYKQIRKGTFKRPTTTLDKKTYIVLADEAQEPEAAENPRVNENQTTDETSLRILNLLTNELNEKNELIRQLMEQQKAQQKTIDDLMQQVTRLTDLVDHSQTLQLLDKSPALIAPDAETAKEPDSVNSEESDPVIVQPDEMQSTQSSQNQSWWDAVKKFLGI